MRQEAPGSPFDERTNERSELAQRIAVLRDVISAKCTAQRAGAATGIDLAENRALVPRASVAHQPGEIRNELRLEDSAGWKIILECRELRTKMHHLVPGVEKL